MKQWEIDAKHWALGLHAKARRLMDKENERLKEQ